MEKIAPVKPLSSLDLPWEDWSEGSRFGTRYQHLSRAAIGKDYRVGVGIEELPPGKQTCPAHYHIFDEEHVYILEGALTVRIGAETHEMKTGDYVCFPAGQKAGHCLINNSGAPCRYVLIGERNPNDVVVYTDSGKVLVRALGSDAIFDLAAKRGYWDGENTGQSENENLPPSAPDMAVQPKPPISSRDVAWDEKHVGRGFVDRNKHLTYAALGENYHVGVLIEGPPPGMRQSPKHYHMLEEEHALILEGEVTLLSGDERYMMKAGDYVCFPAGQKVGHSFMNSSTGPCSYLMIGERNPNEVCVYPDSNKMEVRALRARNSIFDMSEVRDYLYGEQAG